MGNYSRPLKISKFVKELSTAFSILNLKNDNLRKRFDSIKYDVKKIEEGMSLFLSFSLSLCRSLSLSVFLPLLPVYGTMRMRVMVVVYDLSLRGLVPKE